MSNRRRALIIAVSGQDGAYLARHLDRLGYAVIGSTRSDSGEVPLNLRRLGLEDRIELISLDPGSASQVRAAVERFRPDELYMLSAQSSVGASLADPDETFRANAVACQGVLEAVRAFPETRAFFAGSSECFGDTASPANCDTPLRPMSPYAVTKAFAFWQVATYRELYDLHVCTGVLFSHESPLRRQGFVTPKIISAALRIAGGSSERLTLGPVGSLRDWGWAPEYVEAMHLMLQSEVADDFIIATGRSVSLEYFVEQSFSVLGLDWRDHVDIAAESARPSDVARSLADIAKTRDKLGWSARTDVDGVVERLIECATKGDA